MYEPTFEGYTNTQEAPELYDLLVEIFQAHAGAVDIYSQAHSVPAYLAFLGSFDRVTRTTIPARDYNWRSKEIPELL